MKNTRLNILLIALTVLPVFSMQAQQMYQYTQYNFNPLIINPAASGVHDYWDINLGFRRQWAGLAAGPQSYYLSVSKRVGGQGAFYNPSLRIGRELPKVEEKESKIRHGVGGIAAMDDYGMFKKTMGMLSYGFHFQLKEDTYLSIGASLGASSLALDQSDVLLHDAGDNTYTNYTALGLNSVFFDMNMGVMLYNRDLFVGYSNNQLLGDQVQFTTALGPSNLTLHHFVMLGYTIQLNDKLNLTPMGMVKIMAPAPVSFDITARIEYNNQFWGAISYRHTDAIAAVVGYTFNDKVRLGYSYDLTLSGLSDYNNGSHEVALGLMLGKESPKPQDPVE